MRLIRTSTPLPPPTPRVTSPDDKPELGKLIVTTLLAASSAALSPSPAPAQDIARLLAQPSSTTTVMREAPRDTSPMGRAVEIALRTGVLTVPPQVALEASDLTISTPPLEAITLPTLTAPTPAGVTTSAILTADKVWMVNTTALASSSPLSQAMFGDLPAVEQALVHELLATAATTADPVITWQLFNALKQAVTTDAPAAERHALIHKALVQSAPLEMVIALPGVAEHLTPRQQQVFDALVALGDQHVYASGLVNTIVATLLKPEFAASSPTEQQTTLSAVFADRTAYVGVYAADAHHDDVTGAANAMTDAVCSATPARAFRVTDARAHPDGCAQTVTFDTPRGPDSITLITPPTVSADHPAVDETARALSRVDDGVRTLIDIVVLNPSTNPDDAMWAGTPGFSANHRSFMTATTTDNSVHIYPVGAPGVGETRERLLAGTFTHEAGHLLQPRVKADATLQALWTAAVASDDVRASSYAFSNDAEDFAESFAVYQTTKGSLAHEAYRDLMPARFAAFDAIDAKLLAAPAPAPAAAEPRT